MIWTAAICGQELTQTVRGTVVDRETQHPLPGANIVVTTTNPLRGASSDKNGYFKIERVPVGRHHFQAMFMGYENYLLSEVLVTSAKETVLRFELKESSIEMESIEVTADASNKDQAINSMASVSARQLTVEEASRYAGGFDDPSRLASSLAGVAGSLQNNGIVIRGNAPKGLQWRMEGIEITNPSHFADLTVLGGGGITALSSHMLANSDFLTGAFPAEYGNASSGIFDIRLRNGNDERYEHTFQIGGIGTDVSSEGPIIKGKPYSYLFNYRYSTLAIFAPLLPKDAGAVRYQDLSFKFNFPTQAGTFSLWGLGALDRSGQSAEKDSGDWIFNQDREDGDNSQSMGAVGITHNLIIGQNTYVHSAAAASGNDVSWKMKRLDGNLDFQPREYIRNHTWKYTVTSFVNHKFSSRHSNKTGFVADNLHYDITLRNAQTMGAPLETIVDENGGSFLFRCFSQSQFDVGGKLGFNVGFHAQYFTLNGRKTFEPRAGVRYNLTSNQTLTAGYGLHSQLEMIGIYLAQRTTPSGVDRPNKDLDFSKSHHLVLGYENRLSQAMRIKIETYYQRLFDIPVIRDSSFSLLNLEKEWFINAPLVNKGTGHNIGLDVTLERFLSDGYYYLITGSVFDSKYKGGDGVERSTRFNRNYVINILGGKEWQFGGAARTRLLGLNGKFTWMGGDRITPVTYNPETEEVEDIGTSAFSKRKPSIYYADITVSYKIIAPRVTHSWALQLINALGRKEFYGYRYDLQKRRVMKEEELLMIPNISYKIEF